MGKIGRGGRGGWKESCKDVTGADVNQRGGGPKMGKGAVPRTE